MNILSRFFQKKEKSELFPHVDSVQNTLEDENSSELSSMSEANGNSENRTLPEIPEELFVEKSPPILKNEIKIREPLKLKSMETNVVNENSYDLQYLYLFLEKDYQQEGYNDALANPDMSSMEEKIKLIRHQLDITIAKVKTYYSSVLRNINFHIESRKRNGMVDIVDELISKRTTIEEEMSKVAEIEEGAKTHSGISETLIMSYKLGFKNGYAAISHSQML
jgi:hypothetical protein